MNIQKDKHSKHWYINFNKNTFIELRNDWEQIFGKWNWISMNFLQVYFEDDKWTGGYEFEFMVLGLGFRFRHNYKPEILDSYITIAKKSKKKVVKKKK